MSDSSLQSDRAAFANETGRTAEEWLAEWRAGHIDVTAPGMAELAERALDLESRGW